ncbi:hypothetical protein EV715DRAFT_270160 [Schizophyllum commune]
MGFPQDIAAPFPEIGKMPLDAQAVPIPGTKREGQTAHYRNGLWGYVDENSPGAVRTLDKLWERALHHRADRNFLGHRPLLSKNPLKFDNKYVWQTYAEVDVRRKNIGSALVSLFQDGTIGGGELDTVGIWAPNRPEWFIVDLAAQGYKKVLVSLYDTLGPDSVSYIINHSHLTVVFAQAAHIPSLLKLAPQATMLRLIVSLDTLEDDARSILTQWGNTCNIKVIDLAELEALGASKPQPPIPAQPDDIVSICYTSGTTGNPKGALLSHQSLALAVHSNTFGMELPDDAATLSYLPLAHIYERLTELLSMALGMRIGYFSGDNLRLLEDAQILKPECFPSVPRVLNRIYQAASLACKAPGLKGALFRKAVAAKLEKFRATGDNTHPLWDRLVFKKVRAVLGGNVKLVISGSAPISKEVIEFLKVVLACEVDEGYGMTETCATTTKSWPWDPTAAGTTGPPGPCVQVKLVDVPAMNYTAEDKPNPRGELCVRGPIIFKGYYKDEKNTREAIDDEGWLHTGDVAEIDSAGRVKIIDRVKNIMKLAQGEYVALEKVENTYGSCPTVQQIYVHGDSLQSYLLGIVVPDPVQLANIVRSVTGEALSPENVKALEKFCRDERVVRRIHDILVQQARKNGLKGFETIKRIHVTLDPFSVEEGTLTPTLKIRRRDAQNKFKKEIEELYALGEPTSGNGAKL